MLQVVSGQMLHHPAHPQLLLRVTHPPHPRTPCALPAQAASTEALHQHLLLRLPVRHLLLLPAAAQQASSNSSSTPAVYMSVYSSSKLHMHSRWHHVLTMSQRFCHTMQHKTTLVHGVLPAQ
jgi:hypothetical protein